MTGLVIDDSGGFEVLVGRDRVGARRVLGPADVALLEGLTARYVRAVQTRSDPGVFVGLGRELFGWLERDTGQLSGLLVRAGSPLVFQVGGPRAPSAAGWAMLRAPWELLARPDGGFLAEDELARFCVVRRLGLAESPARPDGFRLGLAFMASSPRGQHELDFEAEETAILTAIGDSRVDLLVEDTGDPEQLARRLAEAGGMPVVHVSCHGHNNWRLRPDRPGVPVLMMENEVGEDRPTTAPELVRLLTQMPRLLFVSACLTATGADATGHLAPGDGRKAEPGSTPVTDIEGEGRGGGLVAHSLATGLVSAGVPAVIGWDGSVDDRAATLFAQRLYRALADRADLAVAVGDARRMLLESEDRVVRADWHLARLWLGPGGGGPLVAGSQKRSLVSAAHGTKTFLDRKRQAVPVAAAEMFVGRRPQLQRALGVLRSGEKAGVLLQGQGRLGKSSLAARIADRCPDRAVAVVFGDYSPLAMLDAVAEAVRTNPVARDLIAGRLGEVRERPEAIEAVLIDLLSGPLSQAGEGQRPLLLVIDDLEQILVPDPTGPHRVAPAHARVVAAVLRAFDPAETDSRLLVTSRFTFGLDGLEDRLELVQLPPLSDVAQRKLQRRQQALTPTERQDERAELAERALTVSRGNPGLQDLIGLRLVYGEQVPVSRAEAAVAGMETYLHRGALPSDAEVRAFLENLALDNLLAEAGPANRDLLRAVTLFALPVPEPVITVLAEQVGGSPARLRGLGLLDPYQDLYDPTCTALAANPLAAGRLTPLTPDEQTALAEVSVAALLAAWGGPTPRPGRATELDLQLTRLGLLADDPTILATTAVGAVLQLRAGRAEDALRLGQDATALLDRYQHPVPLDVLRHTADAALTSGDGGTGEALLERAMRQVDAGGRQGIDPLDRARVLGERARRLIIRGEPGQAEQLFRRAHQLFATAGSEQEAAAAMGDIADIAVTRGELDEALRILREVELPVYERLGDTRSVAVTWGKIADIAVTRGELDEALRIRREVTLPVYERLGDTREAAITWGKIADIAARRGNWDTAAELQHKRLEANRQLGDLDGIAAATWDLAQIDLQRHDYQSAFNRLDESFQIFRQLQRADGVAVVGLRLAQLLIAAGQIDDARQVLGESLAAATKIGSADLVQRVIELLAELPDEGNEKT